MGTSIGRRLLLSFGESKLLESEATTESARAQARSLVIYVWSQTTDQHRPQS